jgi:predicted DNA-binding transcriptional regulator YafY
VKWVRAPEPASKSIWIWFRTDEATMLLLGSKLVADHFEAQYREVSQSASRKIEVVLSEKLRGEVNFLRDSIAFVAPETLASNASAKFLPTLRRAIIEQKTIRFHYHTRYSMDRSNAKKTREANPYSLVHYGDAWYLNGFCHLRQELRQFRLDRMSDLELLDQSFIRPADYKMEPPEDNDRNVIVRAIFDPDAAPWVRESRSYYITEMQDDPEGHPGCLLVTMKAHVESELVSWLLSWGAKVDVLEPESLKRRLADAAKKIYEKYSD